MPYNTDGGSHRDGVSNEKKIVNHLNADNGKSLNLDKMFENEGLRFVQIGGTKSVSDMDILTAQDEKLSGTSIKNHKEGSATFDYINTSKLGDYLPEEVVTSMRDGIAAIKEEFYGDKTQAQKNSPARLRKNAVMATAWEHITSDDIKKILQVINSRNPELMMINDIKNKKLKCYRESAFTELSSEPYKASNTYALRIPPRGAMESRQITRNGELTNLRIRITLNNGVTALLGIGSKKKPSNPVIKIQQDNVDAVLAATTMYSSCDFGVEPAEEKNNEDDLSAAMTGLTLQ